MSSDTLRAGDQVRIERPRKKKLKAHKGCTATVVAVFEESVVIRVGAAKYIASSGELALVQAVPEQPRLF